MEGYKLNRVKKSLNRLDEVQEDLKTIVEERIKPLRELAAEKHRGKRAHRCGAYPFRSGYNDDLSWVKGLVDTYNFNPAAVILIAEGFEIWAGMLRQEIEELEQYIVELVGGKHDEKLAEEQRANEEEN